MSPSFRAHVREVHADICDLHRDTFIGMYAVEYVLQMQAGNWDIAKAVGRACRASAKTVAALGCQETIPRCHELDLDM